jgi:cyclopropane-fatty-acyl-phospholipid synthase
VAESVWLRCALPYPASLTAPGLGVLVAALAWPAGADGWKAAAAVLAGLVAWTLSEYLLHRFLLHGVEPFRAWHLAHHRNPTQPIRVPLAFSLALVIAVLGLSFALPESLAAPMSVGLLLGDVLQETVHQGLHAQGVLGLGLARLRAHHGHHHFVDERAAFGTLTTFWDRCFGTAPRSR